MAGWFVVSPVLPTAWLLLNLVKGTAGGDFCYTSGYRLEYCRYGCCGSRQNDCCSLDVALIVGCVVGGILCIAVIITVVCCVLKKQGYRGRVVGPHGMPMPGAGNNVTVVHSNNAAMGYATAPPPPMSYYPPPGNPHPPPYGGYSNPAYPPLPATVEGGGVQGGGFAAPAAPGYTPHTAAP